MVSQQTTIERALGRNTALGLSPPTAAPVTRVGTVLDGKYYIDALLGEGGCGRVYRATHLMLNATVAVKFLLPASASQGVLRARFEREARLLATLCHPGVAAAHDCGEDQGEPYLIMEFVDGCQLGQLMERERQNGIPIPRVVTIAEQILDILAAAHACGITHRDIKPSNIMLYRDGGGTERLKLLDFGLASIAAQTPQPRLTKNGHVVGTAFYMAPEQCRGQVVGPPADIYSVGIMLYQLLTGRLPFSGVSPIEVMVQHIRATPRAISAKELGHEISPRLAKVIMWALEKSPQARPTAVQLRQALGRAMDSTQASCSGSLCVPILEAPACEADGLFAAPQSAPSISSSSDELAVAGTETASWPVVVLWGFSEQRAHQLRSCRCAMAQRLL
mgnify:CR=1 FL=1